MLPEPATTFISTPELSFAIRYLHATAGLNISASHNHPDDNGGKFYNDRCAQEVPPNDEAMAKPGRARLARRPARLLRPRPLG